MTSERHNTNESHYQGYSFSYIKQSLRASAISRRYNNKCAAYTQPGANQRFPFLDISSGNFRISFYIINRSRVKMCSDNRTSEWRFSQWIFYDFGAQSHNRGIWAQKRDFFEWNSSFFLRDFPLVASDFSQRIALLCYPDIRYFLFFLPFSTSLFNFLRVTLEKNLYDMREKTSKLLCVFALLLLSDIKRGQIWEEEIKRFFLPPRAMLEKASLSAGEKTFTSWKQILERKCSGCMISVN